MSTEGDDGEGGGKGGSSRPANGSATHPDAARDGDAAATAAGEFGADLIAFLYGDLGAAVSDGDRYDGAIEVLRRRYRKAAELVRRDGFDRARPYLVKLREARELFDRLSKVPESSID